MTHPVSSCFASSYAEARAKFLAAAEGVEAHVQSHRHPTRQGVAGEELAMDVLRLGPQDAQALLVVSSGTHGIEGYCGSGCQVALLRDGELLERARRAGVALLLVHAVNPYGFSHLHRVNEDNIDLNRNFVDHGAGAPANTAYAEVHPLLLPPAWPPGAGDIAALERYIATHGARHYQAVVTRGQDTHPDGLFYAGRAPAWSNTMLREVLHSHGAGCRRMGWIDIHTGLGPAGHGEKIYAGRNDAAELARARACWGADVFSPFAGESFSEAVRGSAASCLYDECPGVETISLGLEFGTVPLADMLDAVRADQWLSNHPDAPQAQRLAIKQQLRDAFSIDSAEWRGMVSAQTRVAVLQAVSALSSH